MEEMKETDSLELICAKHLIRKWREEAADWKFNDVGMELCCECKEGKKCLFCATKDFLGEE